MRPWYEDDDFWRAVRPVLFSPGRMARTYVPVPTWYEGGGVYLLEEVRVEAGWDTVHTRWVVVAQRPGGGRP